MQESALRLLCQICEKTSGVCAKHPSQKASLHTTRLFSDYAIGQHITSI